MSESVGSNAFPAEGKKSHYKKRNRQEVESGDRSTTQQSFKMTKHLHFEDSLPVQETEMLYSGEFLPVQETEMLYSGEFLPVQETERLYSGEFLPVQETQSPEERFQAVDPKSKELLDTYEPQIVLDHPNVFHIVEIAAKKKIFYYPPRGYSDAEAKLIRKKILKKRKISVTDEEVKRVMKCLHFKFDLYCWNMQRGFQGVKFDYDSGTFSQVINLKANSPDLMEEDSKANFGHQSSESKAISLPNIGLEHCITATSGTERNLLMAEDEIMISRSMTEKRALRRHDLILDRLSEHEKEKLIANLVKIQKDGTVEVDLERSASVASELLELQSYEESTMSGSFIISDSKKSVPRLQIVILVVGTRGDVQPFVAIAKRLQEYGHRVRIAIHANFKTFVRSAGVNFHPLGGDPRVLAGYMARNKG